MKKIAVIILSMLFFSGCVLFKTKPTSFRAPEDYPGHANANGVIIGCQLLDTADACLRQFSVDLNAKGVLPVRLVVRNDSRQRVEIISSQILGIIEDGSMYNTLTADQAIDTIKKSQTAKGATQGAAAGAVLGGAAGAGVGAILGGNSEGTESGAAIGGVIGAVGGGLKGAESIDAYLTKEIRNLEWSDREIRPNYVINGFLFLPKADYKKLDIGILNTSENLMQRVTLDLKSF